MSEQLPIPAPVGANRCLPPLPIDDGALLKFSRELNLQLHDFEQRFVQPRRHPRLVFGHARQASRKPR